MAYIEDPEVIDKLIEDQEKWIAEATTSNTPNLAKYMDNHRKTFPKREDLILYLHKHLDIVIPYRGMCTGHCAPVEFLDHMLFCEGDVLAQACRSGGKTQQTGISCGMDAYPFKNRKGLQVRELGSSSDQGKRVYEEFESFVEAGYKDKVKGDVLQARTTFEGGSRVEMLMQSQKSVRGPHVPRLKLDEIEEFDEQIFNAALSIPKGTKEIHSMVSMSSTFHKPRGLMSKQMRKFHGKILIWCIFEILEKCDGACSTCNLASYCPGWEKMQHAVGYVPIREARAQRNRILDDEVYESEALCRRPRTEGLVYKRFNSKIHGQLISYNPMYPLFRSFDYGTDHPTVLGYWQIISVEGRQQARCIDEKRWRATAPSVMVNEMLMHEQKCGYSGFENTYVPMDAAGFRAELENAGVGTTIPNQDVNAGIGTVRNLLVPDSNGTLGFVIHKEKCKDTIEEMESYNSKNGAVVKEADDGPDSARYLCHSRPELRVACKPVIAIATYDMVN